MGSGFERDPGKHSLVREAESKLAATTISLGKRTLVEAVGVQLSVSAHGATPKNRTDSGTVQKAAAQGIAGGGGPLLHAETIQRLFGRHDISGIEAHVGGPAATASQAIGAEAYATGHHVAFASAPTLHTAAHEAAHVVQQRGGVQLSRGMGEPGDEYERHADAVADAVVRGESSEVLLDRYAGRGEGERPTLTSSRGVQRKVGFEFETDFTVSQNQHKLAKTNRIGTQTYDGFKVESDDDGRLEVIIHPPIEITPNLPVRLAAIFDNIEAYCMGLQAAARNNRTEIQPEVDFENEASDGEPESPGEPEEPDYNYDPFALSAATGVPGDAIFTVLPRQGDVAGNPQITTGLTLEQIANLGTYHHEQPLPDGVGDAITSSPATFVPRVTVQACTQAGINVDRDLGGRISDEMKGMLTLVASYLVGGTTEYLEYPKIITDRFLLSRTALSMVIKEMPEWRYFARNLDQWVALALAVACVDGADVPVYVHGVLVNANLSMDRAPFGPTRDAWLRGLVAGTDLLSAAQNPQFESMGEFGTRRETVGTRGGESLVTAGIFEMRGGQTRSRPYTEWREYALATARFLMNMQRDPNGHLGLMKRNQERNQGYRKLLAAARTS